MFTNFQNIKAIIFDFDGTLYNYNHLARNIILNRIYDLLKIKADRDTREELKGQDFGSVEKYLDCYFKCLASHAKKDVPFMKQWYYNKYLPHLHKIMETYYSPYPGVEEMFSKLTEAGILFAIYSDHSDIIGRIEALGLNPKQCGNLFSAEDFGATKPAKRPFIEIAKQLETPCEEILVVGDRFDTDGDGAFSAGMNYIRIASYKSDKETPEERLKLNMQFETLTWNDFFVRMLNVCKERKLQVC